MHRTVLTAAVGAGFVLAASGVATAQHGEAVDALFRRFDRTDSPGAAVLVVHDGEVVHRKGYGMADLEHGVRISPSTVFDIASVSKQFCGLSIAMLIEQKKLGYDDDVRKYVPWVPAFGGRKITIAHLVHHTSGIRDWPGALRLAGWRFDDVISFEQILRMLRHQRDLNFDPGTRYSYSNTGYNLLAHVVEKQSGVSFAQWTKQMVFDPLEMRDTHFHDDHARVVKNRASAYARAGNKWKNIANHLTAVGSSSLFTTIDDLGKWVLNFETQKVAGQAAFARMHQRGKLNGGQEIAYCFGVSKGTHRGLPTVSHTGSWAGFRTILTRYPEQRFAVVVLANTATVNPGSRARQIAEVFLASSMAPKQGVASGKFAAAGERAERPDLDPFVGTYHSAELRTSYEVVGENGGLILRHFRNGDVALRHGAGDRFHGPRWAATVRFVRDDEQRVSGLLVSSGRCIDMRFVRVR